MNFNIVKGALLTGILIGVMFSEQVTAQEHSPDDQAIVELTALIAFQNMSSKFNTALAIKPQGFCKIEHKIHE